MALRRAALPGATAKPKAVVHLFQQRLKKCEQNWFDLLTKCLPCKQL